MIRGRIPLQISEVPSGTWVFDWTVPKEWNIRDAYIKDAGGKRVVDFQQCNLHVLNYSTPVHATMSLSELKPHSVYAPGASGLDSLPHVLLPREMGILSVAQADADACRRRLRGMSSTLLSKTDT